MYFYNGKIVKKIWWNIEFLRYKLIKYGIKINATAVYTNFRSMKLEKRVEPRIDSKSFTDFNDLFLSFFLSPPFFFRYLKHRGGKNWRAHTIDRRRKITREDKKIRSALSLPPYRFEDYFLFLCFIYTRRKYAFIHEQPWPEKPLVNV